MEIMRVADGPMDLNFDEDFIARHFVLGPKKTKPHTPFPKYDLERPLLLGCFFLITGLISKFIQGDGNRSTKTHLIG